MRYKLGKSNKLKSKTTIDRLFNEGKSVTAFPLRLVYLKNDDDTRLKVGFSVSKRLHKTAVARNHIKRLTREAFRLSKPIYFNNSSTSYAFMILYISKEGTTFEALHNAMTALLEKFVKKTAQNETKTS
jgi:ribonuclease P protein component